MSRDAWIHSHHAPTTHNDHPRWQLNVGEHMTVPKGYETDMTNIFGNKSDKRAHAQHSHPSRGLYLADIMWLNTMQNSIETNDYRIIVVSSTSECSPSYTRIRPSWWRHYCVTTRSVRLPLLPWYRTEPLRRPCDRREELAHPESRQTGTDGLGDPIELPGKIGSRNSMAEVSWM